MTGYEQSKAYSHDKYLADIDRNMKRIKSTAKTKKEYLKSIKRIVIEKFYDKAFYYTLLKL